MTKTDKKLVPFTLLTGFLGAGKTTVLNRALSALARRGPGSGKKVAVLVNELGRISIDSQLILGGGSDILELAGGCLCCKVDVKNDLWDGIVDVIKRSEPDHVILETTGIAEPQIILDDLSDRLSAQDSDVAGRVKDCGVVCVADPVALHDELARREEVKLQIECADRLLLSKLDIASADQVSAAHETLAGMRPDAERASFPEGQEALLADWLLATIQARKKPRAHGHRHHGRQIVAVAFESDAPLIEDLTRALIDDLSQDLLRVKGFVRFVGADGLQLMELAGGRLTVESSPERGGQTQLVLIGEDLDEPTIRRRLWACTAGGGDHLAG